MRKSWLFASIIFWCLLLFTSCQDNFGTAPEIKFISPYDTQSLDLDKTIPVEIDIWDDQKIDSYEIFLTSQSGLEYFREEKFLNKQVCTLLYHFDLSSSKNKSFNITIEVKDNQGSVSKSSILINNDN